MGPMQIARRVDYGLRAIVYLSVQGPERCSSITEIAKQQGAPKKLLEKIIRDLIRCGLIKSKRGACGGYTLARSPEQISFSDVIEAIEGQYKDSLSSSSTTKLQNRQECVLMARYSILAFCSYCDRTHPARLSITLQDGPTRKTTVAEAFKHKTLPSNLARLLNNAILCPETANSVMLNDRNKVYLVPIS
jgi:Rrf2 family protein